jgi:hypothetical protein
MTHPYYPSGNPRFNHVALSVPPDLLDEINRADLCRSCLRAAVVGVPGRRGGTCDAAATPLRRRDLTGPWAGRAGVQR